MFWVGKERCARTHRSTAFALPNRRDKKSLLNEMMMLVRENIAAAAKTQMFVIFEWPLGTHILPLPPTPVLQLLLCY